MGEDITLSHAHDFAVVDELAESSDETLIAYLETRSEIFGGKRLGRFAQQSEDLLGDRIARRGLHGKDCGYPIQVGSRFGVF